MPYIEPHRRIILNNHDDSPQTIGEMNYLITRQLMSWLKGRKESYTNYNEVMGLLTCVQKEFYRRVVVPYEKKKCSENGDVYPEEK